MKRILTMASGIVLLAGISAFAVDPQRSWNGWGASVTASTTPTSITIEQPEGDNLVLNGTFANTNNWILGNKWTVSGNAATFTTTNMLANGTFANTNGWLVHNQWTIGSGVLSFTTDVTVVDAVTNTPTTLTSGTVYSVQYTVSSLAGTLGLAPVLGVTTGTLVTANGTYIENITANRSGGSTLSFVGSSTDAATGKIDNVSIRLAGLVETNDLYQAISSFTAGKSYRVRYTITGMDTDTNSVLAMIGSNYKATVTADGTYTDDIPCLTESNLMFRAISTNISSFSVSSVSAREVPKTAFAEYVTFRIGATDLPVYVAWDCPASVFTNIYATSRAILVDSNAVVSIDRNSCAVPIHTIWYRTASGSASLKINAH